MARCPGYVWAAPQTRGTTKMIQGVALCLVFQVEESKHKHCNLRKPSAKITETVRCTRQTSQATTLFLKRVLVTRIFPLGAGHFVNMFKSIVFYHSFLTRLLARNHRATRHSQKTSCNYLSSERRHFTPLSSVSLLHRKSMFRNHVIYQSKCAFGPSCHLMSKTQ